MSSRREDRDSHSKRHHSRSERDLSPKRPRRDGKPATERTYSINHNLEMVDSTDRDRKQRRRLQDALPLEASPAPESKTRSDVASKELDRKADGLSDDTKHSIDPAEVPRSRSYFQHDERSSAGKGGRGFGRRATENERRTTRNDTKEPSSDHVKDNAAAGDLQKNDEKSSDMHKKDEKTRFRTDDNNVWRHDGYYELEAEEPPPRRRPAFRENKFQAEGSAPGAIETEASKPPRHDRPVFGSVRREERGGHYPPGDKSERPSGGADERNGRRGDGSLHREEMHRTGYQPRDRFSSGWGARGRDRYNGRFGERNQYNTGGGGFQVEKWKHDLFDEANQNPNPKNEEDQIAKIEALLTS